MEHGKGGKPSNQRKAGGENKRFDRKTSGEKPHSARKTGGESKRFDGKASDGKQRFDRRMNGEKPLFERKAGGESKRFDRKTSCEKPLFERKAGGSGFQGGKPPLKRRPQVNRPEPHVPTARDLALQALRSVEQESAYAAQALDRELNASKLSDEDRRLAANLYYTSIENRLRIEHVLAQFMSHRAEPELMEILTLAAAQLLFMDRIPDHAAVDEAVKQARRARFERQTGMVNGVLRSLIRGRDAGEITLPDRESEPEAYISERYSVALPLVKRLIQAYGVDETERIAAWKPERGVETIRPNRMRLRGAGFEAWMSQAGLNWSPSPVEDAYHVTGAGRLASHMGYREGLFSIQGEGSMLAAQAVRAKPGMQVLDACAAPGGKTCLIAETMRGTGRVYAWDLHEHRVELIRAAANRLGLENIRPQTRDASKKNDSMIGAMDAVLIDAPCSGLGVIGAKPDIKYRLNDAAIDALIPVQRNILNMCAAYVRPEGLLVYSTCTILPEENENQVRAFLAAHPDFEPDTDALWLPEPMRARYKDGMIQILPSRDDMEGFFIARMRRKADAYDG